MAQHSLCSAMTPVLLTACQRQPSSSPSFVHMFNPNCVTHLIKFYPFSQIIYHISLVYNCGNTCGKFCDSLTIFEKVSSKKPNCLLRCVITCIITVLVHTSHLSSGTHLSSKFYHTSFLWIIYVILRTALIVQHSLHSAYTLPGASPWFICSMPVFIHILKSLLDNCISFHL